MTMRLARTLPPAAAPIPLSDVLRGIPSCFGALGSKDSAVESDIATVFGQRYCFLVSSGKAALTLILRALKSQNSGRDTVVAPAYTCYSVPAAIKRARCTIQLCDTAPDSLDFDLDHLQTIIAADQDNRRICCILATHLYGNPAPFDRIRELTGTKIPIVEDAAQAFGVIAGEKVVGTDGDIGFYSLGRGKALSTIAGGVIVTNNQNLGETLSSMVKGIEPPGRLAALRVAMKALIISLLQKPALFWLPKMIPYLKLGETMYEDDFEIQEMTAYQRYLASNWRRRLSAHQKSRRQNGDFWVDNLPVGYTLPVQKNNVKHLIRLPVLSQSRSQRDEICLTSEHEGCGIMPGYPAPIFEIPEIAMDFQGQSFPHAKSLADRLFTLPVHEYVTDKDRETMIKILQINHENVRR